MVEPLICDTIMPSSAEPSIAWYVCMLNIVLFCPSSWGEGKLCYSMLYVLMEYTTVPTISLQPHLTFTKQDPDTYYNMHIPVITNLCLDNILRELVQTITSL